MVGDALVTDRALAKHHSTDRQIPLATAGGAY